MVNRIALWLALASLALAACSAPPSAGDPTERGHVVFFGDSITALWSNAMPAFFVQHGYVDRGISGQTTVQTLERFDCDVIDAKPRVVVILAGTNDIAESDPPYDDALNPGAAGRAHDQVAVLTVSTFQEDRDAIVAAGCDEVLSKPLDEGQLSATMERLLSLHFHYVDTASHMEPTEAVNLSGLAAEQVDELLRAASQLDVEATMQAVESIRGADAQLADQLAELTRAFRFDRIVAASEQQVRKS